MTTNATIKPDASVTNPVLSERVNGRCPLCKNAHVADHIPGRLLFNAQRATVPEPEMTRERFLDKWAREVMVSMEGTGKFQAYVKYVKKAADEIGVDLDKLLARYAPSILCATADRLEPLDFGDAHVGRSPSGCASWPRPRRSSARRVDP